MAEEQELTQEQIDEQIEDEGAVGLGGDRRAEVRIGESIVGTFEIWYKRRPPKEVKIEFKVEEGTAGDYEGGRKSIAAHTFLDGVFASNFYGREIGETKVSFTVSLDDDEVFRLEDTIVTVGEATGGMWIDFDRIVTLPEEGVEGMPKEPSPQAVFGSSLVTAPVKGNRGMNTKHSKTAVPMQNVRLAQNCTFREDDAFVKRNGYTKINNSVPVN